MVFLSFDESPAGSSPSSSASDMDSRVSEGAVGPPCINPALLRLWYNMCCCWFDTTQVNDCVMYGVVAVTPRRGDVALVKFPEWVNVIQPIGPEDEREFSRGRKVRSCEVMWRPCPATRSEIFYRLELTVPP
ncbi:hypothetical protein HRG_014225 [Hirsutella rhossiliensis]